ncbi:MAG: putative OB-fold protein [Halioglobus sp.]|jgi:uncharacterized OB-fold protein
MGNTLVQEFRDGLANGRLLIQRCADCEHLDMYPRYSCVGCQSENLDWAIAAGTGLLHSFTVLRAGAPEGFENDLPYALAVVKLDEGVQLLGRLTPGSDGSWDHYQCDAKVCFDRPATQGDTPLQYPMFSLV